MLPNSPCAKKIENGGLLMNTLQRFLQDCDAYTTRYEILGKIRDLACLEGVHPRG
jgi:hypothetical protein